MQARQTAYKLWIASILSSPYTKTTGEFSPNYITFKDQQISRVNIMANVIETFASPEDTHASLTVDDGSGTIRIRVFKDNLALLRDIEMGDLVLIIGKIREYNNELYILPEIVKKLTNASWGKLRRLELTKEHGKPPALQQAIHLQEIPQQHTALQVQTVVAPVSEITQGVLSSIEKSEEGVSLPVLATSLNITQGEVEKIILELLKNNDIYQNKPGHYKVL